MTDSRPGTPSVESERKASGSMKTSSAVDDVDLDRTFGGAHPYIAVAHEQVSALDKLDAHLLGEEHVFEIGAVVAAGGEQNDHWVVRD